MSNKNLPVTEEKVTIGCYISLFLAIIFFSGVAAGSAYFWSFLDFTTLMGSAGKVVGKVAQTEEGIATTLTTMRGVGGSGAIDGFMMAISMIVPGVMLAMAMISVFEHYGALRAAKQLLSPVLRFLIGVPGTATLALIACLQSTDGGAAVLAFTGPDGTTTVPLSMGTGLAVLLVAKVIGANIMRLIQARMALREKKNETAPVAAPVTISIERN